MHGDHARAADYEDPMCARLLGTAADVLGQLGRLITDQFRDITAAGAAMYASFLGAEGSDVQRRHAHGRIAALRKALHAQGIGLEA